MKFENPFSKPKSKDNTEVDLSRRNFLINSSIVAGEMVAGGLLAVGADQSVDIYKGKTFDDYKRDVVEVIDKSELEKSIEALKSEIEQLYGINIELTKIEINDSSIKLFGLTEELRLSKKLEALRVLSTELAKYPVFVINQSGLKNIALTERSQTSNIDGYLSPNHLEATDRIQQPELVMSYDWNEGKSTPEQSKISLEASSKLTLGEREILRKGRVEKMFSDTIQHELAHFFIDVPGTEATPKHDEAKLISDWENSFGTHNRRMRMIFDDEAKVKKPNGEIGYDYAKVTSSTPGFARGYGLKNSEEDRATIIEKLMMGFYSEAQNLDPTDKLLQAKIQKIKDYYYNLSFGLMDEYYWQSINFEVHDEMTGETVSPQAQAELRAKGVVSTPYQKYPLKDKVSEETYVTWQLKLATVYNL